MGHWLSFEADLKWQLEELQFFDTFLIVFYTMKRECSLPFEPKDIIEDMWSVFC